MQIHSRKMNFNSEDVLCEELAQCYVDGSLHVGGNNALSAPQQCQGLRPALQEQANLNYSA